MADWKAAVSDFMACSIRVLSHWQAKGWAVFWGLVVLAPVVAWIAHRTLGLSLTVDSWPAGMWLLLGAPILEEWLFRQGLQQGLVDRGCSPRAALVGTALVFAACHFPQEGFLCIGWIAPGLALGLMWERSGRRLGPCIVLHAWFNIVLGISS